MYVLKTMVHETIWGGNRLTALSGTDNKSIGHLYSVFDVDGKANTVQSSDKYNGKSLHDLFEGKKKEWGLDWFKEFPLVIALVDATDDLSIQVHPDDEMANKLLQRPFGKNESFYFIEAPASGKTYDGCNCKSSDELKKAIDNGKIGEAVGTVDIKKGDYVYIQAGTLHAAAKGSLIFEIEENSEVTYRFYDFDRIDKDGKKRPLQLDKALMCLDPQKQSAPEPMKQDGDNWYRHRMYSVKHFVKDSVYTNDSKTVACATLMSGEVTLSSGIKVTPGTAVLLEPNESIDFGKCEFMVTIPQYGFKL